MATCIIIIMLGLKCFLSAQAAAPQWSSRSETTSVSEGAALGTMVPVTATISNTPTSIEILPGPSRTVALSKFRVDLRGDDRESIEITVISSIDRETTSEYILDLRASNDDGDTSSDFDLKLTITVRDINDNAPKFSLNKCLELETVPEQFAAIEAYTATDPDGTFGLGKSTYSISGGSSFYEIDAETGLVSVKGGAVIYDGQYTSLKSIAVDDSATNQRTGTGYLSLCIGQNCCSQSSSVHIKSIHAVIFALQIFKIFL